MGGTPEQVAQTLREYAEAGVDELIIGDFNLPRDLGQKTAIMDRFMNEAVPLAK